MESKLNSFKKYSFRFTSGLFAFLLVFIFQYAYINPTVLLAQEAPNDSGVERSGFDAPAEAQVDEQAVQTITNAEISTEDKFKVAAGTAAESITTGGLSCIGANIISNVLQKALTSLFGGILSISQEVPIKELQYRGKEVGTSVLGVPTPSWDAIGFCLINIIIDYITEATIQWINGGFQGNPVFVEDPARFFRTIADYEAGAFIEQIGVGKLFCEPFRPNIQVSLANQQRGKRFVQNSGTCRLSEVAENAGDFINGSFNDGGWRSWFTLTQDPYSNPYDSHTMAQAQLKSTIAGKQNVAKIELDWGAGFLSFKNENGETTTPGKLIEGRINERLGAPDRRIEMADEFDEIVNALVNQLIKVALNEILSTDYKSNGTNGT